MKDDDAHRLHQNGVNGTPTAGVMIQAQNTKENEARMRRSIRRVKKTNQDEFAEVLHPLRQSIIYLG